MKTVFLNAVAGVILSVFMAFGAQAQQAEIQGTIGDQITAFQADDFDTAFTFATPRLQELFVSPQNFQRMVTGGYPMVHRPAEVRYLDLRQENGAFMQKVEIIDAQGKRHLLDYRMEPTEAGWRIGGVQIIKVPEVAA